MADIKRETTPYDRVMGSHISTMPKDPLARKAFLDDFRRGQDQIQQVYDSVKTDGISLNEAKNKILGPYRTSVQKGYMNPKGNMQDEEYVAPYVQEAYNIASPCAEQLRAFVEKYVSSPLFHHKGGKGEELSNVVSNIIKGIDALSPQNMLPMMSDNTYRGTTDNNAGAMWSPPRGMVQALDAGF